MQQKMQWQCNVNTNELARIRDATQQRLCINFVRATFECNAGQCETELLLTLFHKCYIRCVK